VKFPQESVNQKVLKSVHFLPSYSKYKRDDQLYGGTFFKDTVLREIGALKMTDMKMTDQLAGHENAGHENDGPTCRA